MLTFSFLLIFVTGASSLAASVFVQHHPHRPLFGQRPARAEARAQQMCRHRFDLSAPQGIPHATQVEEIGGRLPPAAHPEQHCQRYTLDDLQFAHIFYFTATNSFMRFLDSLPFDALIVSSIFVRFITTS